MSGIFPRKSICRSVILELLRENSLVMMNRELSKKYSKHSQALQLFQKGHTKLQVAIELGLTDSEIIKEYKQYMVLNGFDGFCEMYDGMAGDMGSYIFLHHELKSAGINVRDAIEGIKVAWQLNQLKTERDGLLAENVGLKSEIYTSSNELEDLKREKNALLGVLAEARVEVLNEIADRDRIQDDHTRVRRGRFRDTQNSSPNKRDLHVNK